MMASQQLRSHRGKEISMDKTARSRSALGSMALAAVAALTLAACGSSSHTSTGPAATKSPGAGSSGGAAKAAASVSPSGKPIVIGLIYTASNNTGNDPELEVGADAAAD